VVKIEPTDIMIGVLNFSTGDVEHYKFKVLFIRRAEDAIWNNTMFAHGVITFDSGKSYEDMKGLCYTDSAELEKLAEPMRKATPMTRDEVWHEMNDARYYEQYK